MDVYARGCRTVRDVVGPVALLTLLIGCGWAASSGRASLLFALIVVFGLAALAWLERGAAIGILVLAAMDGLPFYDTGHALGAGFTVQDLAIFALIGCAFAWRVSSSGPRHATRPARILAACGAALLLWCAFTLLRTNTPFLPGLRFGIDFVSFAVLLILLPGVRLSPRDLRVLLAVLGAGAAVFAVGQILTVERLGGPSGLIHYSAGGTQNGLVRVFAPMIDLVTAGLAVSIAVLALGRGSRMQRIAIPMTLLLGASLVVQLTRARWIALLASILSVSLWFALQGESRLAARSRRWLGGLIGALLTAVTALLLVAPGATSGGAVVQRFFSVFTDLGSSNSATSTVAVRVQVAHDMLAVLGGRWPIGVGLVPPSVHYYSGLPGGSLRDTDLGVLNALMTIGVVGAVLMLLPLVVVLVTSMLAVRTDRSAERAWLNHGGQIWIVATLFSSVTLVTLFSKGGVALSATFLAVLCQPQVLGDPSRTSPSAVAASRAPIRTHPLFAAQRAQR